MLANGRNVIGEVARFVATAQGPNVGALIIGYDTMLKETLKTLIASSFTGPILTTSTLTEPNWQPEDTSRDTAIYTVVPHRDEVEGRPAVENGVVYLFSKLALASTLNFGWPRTRVRRLLGAGYGRSQWAVRRHAFEQW